MLRAVRRLLRLAQEHRLERSEFHRGEQISRADAVFVVGCGRSGTTLMRAMLDRHPNLWGGPESWIWLQPVDPPILALKFGLEVGEIREMLARSRTGVEFAERCFGECAKRAGKRRWVEKTPRHVQFLPYLMHSFPNAKFIHMVRDGRDVACSLRHHPKAKVTPKGAVPIRVNNPIGFCIDRWVRDTSAGLAYQGHPRLLTVRYERLIAETDPTMREVCDFLGEAFHPEILVPQDGQLERNARSVPSNLTSFEPINSASVGRWKRDLRTGELAICLRNGGALLQTLGYWDGEPISEPHGPDAT